MSTDESSVETAGEAKLRSDANMGAMVMGTIVVVIVVWALSSQTGWFESKEQQRNRLSQEEMSASLELRYCAETGTSCAAARAKLEVIQEQLRDTYR